MIYTISDISVNKIICFYHETVIQIGVPIILNSIWQKVL